MPGHRVHRFVDRQLFGKSYWRIHVKMDEPSLVLGSGHRVLFHDPDSAVAIAKRLYPNDPDAIEGALNHIWLDTMCSNDPVFKAQFEFLAERDTRERARIRKQKKNITKRLARACSKSKKSGKMRARDSIKEFLVFYKQVKEFEYWARLLSK